MNDQIQELYKPLFLYVRKRINQQEDAEDLTQEVFYKLSKSENGEVDNVKSWVYTIAKNTITDFYRKKKVLTEEINDLSSEEEYKDDNALKELGGCVSAYIAELPDEYRHILELSEMQGVPQKEIAKQLGMNYVTVRSKIQRGRKKLKDLFTACCSFKQSVTGSILEYEPHPVRKSKPIDCSGKE